VISTPSTLPAFPVAPSTAPEQERAAPAGCIDHAGCNCVPAASLTRSSAEAVGLRTMVEVALPIARARAQLIRRMRTALECGDDRTALALAREVAGLP
jgi:hypothetical protein